MLTGVVTLNWRWRVWYFTLKTSAETYRSFLERREYFISEKRRWSQGVFAIYREFGNPVWGCREAYTIYFTGFNVTPSVPKWLIGFSLRILSHDGRSPAYITSKMWPSWGSILYWKMSAIDPVQGLSSNPGSRSDPWAPATCMRGRRRGGGRRAPDF